MTRTHSRRDFVKLALGSTAGLGVLPLLGRGAGGADVEAAGRLTGGGARAAELPPRVIGLRSLGGDFRFDPAGLRVAPGEAVTWLNMGDFHTSSAFHPDNAELLGGDVPLRIPEGAVSWHSGMLGLTGGTEFRYTPEVEGVYDYFCQPHYAFGMVGRFIAGEPRGGPAVRRPLAELNEPSRAAMPAVETIMGRPGRGFEWAARINGLLYLRAHGEAGESAAEAVRAGVEEDGELARLLEGAKQGASFREALDGFLAAYGEDDGYEELASLADGAKAPLRNAVAGAG